MFEGHQPNDRPRGPGPGSRPGSRSGSLERRKHPQHQQQQQGVKITEVGVEVAPGEGRCRTPVSPGSFPMSASDVKNPPPRQLFELPHGAKRDNPYPQKPISAKDMVPPEVIEMYSGRNKKNQQQQPSTHHSDPQFHLADDQSRVEDRGLRKSNSQSSFSRSNSLRRSQQGTDTGNRNQRRQPEPQRHHVHQAPPSAHLDISKHHMSLANSHDNMAPRHKNQHRATPTKQLDRNAGGGTSGIGSPETTHLVKPMTDEEVARLPKNTFEKKPKWQPMRPDKFSIFGREAAYPPFPIIGPSYMISVSGGAKFIEIILSIICLICVTIICDRGRCFKRHPNPLASEVTMWVVTSCAIVATIFLCVPYAARKKPLSPKTYYRFLQIEVFLCCLGALSYFVASICLLVIEEDDIRGYLIETWVVAGSLGLVCGVLYVCSAVFAYLALQRAQNYLNFLQYASHRHRDTAAQSYRLSVHPNVPPPQQHQQSYPPQRQPLQHQYQPAVHAGGGYHRAPPYHQR